MAEIVERKPTDTAKDIARRVFTHENSVLALVLVGLVAVFAVMTKSKTVTPENVMNIILASSIRGVASIGQLFCILSAGIDFSVGGIALLCMFLSSSVMDGKVGPAIVGVGFMVALLGGAGVGVFNGLGVSRLRIPALIVTLTTWIMLPGFAFLVTHGATLWNLPRSLAFFGQGHIAGVPILAIIFVVTAAIGYFVLYYTTYGRSVYAIGGNPITAWLSGIKVKNIQFSIYVISGFLAGFAGFLTASRSMMTSMTSIIGLELDSVTAVIVGGVSLMGGKGTLIGAVIGVMIIGVINNGMNVLGLHPSFQTIVKGVIIFTAVAIDQVRKR